jgi:hypothetical protein
MNNGNSVLDESASALFVYDAPEIERSKVLFEELYRSLTEMIYKASTISYCCWKN